jgi:tetratricopeptide (TPR) repeat protein
MRIEWMEKQMLEAERLIYDNQVENGLALLNNLLYEEPGYGSLHNHIGWAHLYYSADVVKTERHLKLAIAFDPAFGAPYQHLGALYIRVGRYNEAVQILQEGLKQPNANRVAMLEGIAHAYELKREYGKAIATYKEALVSTVGFETTNFSEGIKRCRKKRWAMMFTF